MEKFDEITKTISIIVLLFILNILAQGLASISLVCYLSIKGEMEYFLNYAAVELTICSSLLVIISLWFYYFCKKRKFHKEVFLTKLNVRFLVPLFLLSISLGFLIDKFVELIPWPESFIKSYNENTSIITEKSSLLIILGAVIIGPIFEEIIFRGIIYKRLKRSMPTVFAILISSILFAVIHDGILWMSYTFLLGLIFAWVFEMCDSLIASVLVHALFNLLSLVSNYILPHSSNVMTFICTFSLLLFVLSIIWIYRQRNICQFLKCSKETI